MLERLCGPVILYIGFCLVQILIDLVNKKRDDAFIKTIVMIVFSVVLQLLCMKGLSIISWIIVFIPFILFTYITAVIMFVFGLNPDQTEFNKRADVTVYK